MTAGGWMYIGTQGICHGTYITIINAARKYLNLPNDKNLAGICFVSSGLGGMSCAQPKAMKIAGGIAVVAEVDYSRIKQKLKQHWIDRVSNNLVEVEELILEYKKSGRPLALAYYGNIVDLLEYLSLCQVPIELISDQTSCHVVYEGGYTPVDFDFTSSRRLMDEDNPRFRAAVNDSLKRHFQAIGRMINQGSHFWDYGNSFMYAVMKSGEKRITKNGQDDRDGYIWPSYVEDIMGPLCFDYGFGPFRWVCLSGEQADLDYTDELALNLINPEQSSMHNDNYEWIAHAKEYNLVVGTKARILYNDEEGRIKIALAFNKAVRDERVGPIMIGRDHHDVSGTDSPSRETANIYDGSRPTADMSVQCFGGNIARGMTLVVLSNGGGVGIGLASNGGNGIVLDGSRRIDKIIKSGLSWDVMGGVARRNWARNPQAMATAKKWNKKHETSGQITIPNLVNNDLIDKAVSDAGLVQ